MDQRSQAGDLAAQGRKDLESSAAWQETEREFLATGRVAAVQRFLGETVDRAAVKSFHAALASDHPDVVMVAAGAYARGELFPYSNPDLVVIRRDSSPAFNDSVEEFIRSLWAEGIRPGLRVYTIAECMAAFDRNLDLGAKLLDRRTLAGDASLAAQLDTAIAAFIANGGQRLVDRLSAQALARHSKFRDTPSHAQPDVEETPGGLRDLRLLANIEALLPSPTYLVDETEQLGEAARFLSRTLCFLHYRARREYSVLDREAQEAIARQGAQEASRAPWMREYFKHARKVSNRVRRTLAAYEGNGSPLAEAANERQSRLSNAAFSVLHGRVYLRRTGDLAQNAEAVFQLLEFVARHGIPAAPETEQRLEAARSMLAAYCKDARALWPEVKEILSLPHAHLALRLLQRADLMPALLPEWLQIEGAIAEDPVHSYTLDEHALMAIERIHDLSQAADPATQRFSQITAEIDDRPALLFALLFHETGSDAEGSDRLGASALAAQAAARIKMPASEQALIGFLIERQTSLSDAVTGRDLDDPTTVRGLAERIGTVERLRLLSLLTYADISATSSEATIPWRLEQLSRTYTAIHRELTRELESDRIEELPPSLVEESEFLKGFPTRYLRTRTSEEVAAHTRLYQRSRETAVAVDLQTAGGVYKLSVVAQDRPALFASFAGAISSFGLDIVQAEAFSNSKGVILDTFVFADPKRTLALNPSETERLRDLIGRIALGKTEARRLFRNQPRASGPAIRRAEPQVQFDSEACETATLVEISAEDRLGLLYSLASVFSSNACNIETVLVDTKGNRAIDVFYVSQSGRKLTPAAQAALERQLAAACLGIDSAVENTGGSK